MCACVQLHYKEVLPAATCATDPTLGIVLVHGFGGEQKGVAGSWAEDSVALKQGTHYGVGEIVCMPVCVVFATFVLILCPRLHCLCGLRRPHSVPPLFYVLLHAALVLSPP